MASISSNRLPAGWSKCDRPKSSESRHWNFSPSVSQGMANPKAYLPSSPAGTRRVRAGYTAISSDSGPSVASTRAPRTTMPASVSLTTDSATSVRSSKGVAPTERLRCKLTSVCVITMSFSRIYS